MRYNVWSIMTQPKGLHCLERIDAPTKKEAQKIARELLREREPGTKVYLETETEER